MPSRFRHSSERVRIEFTEKTWKGRAASVQHRRSHPPRRWCSSRSPIMRSPMPTPWVGKLPWGSAPPLPYYPSFGAPSPAAKKPPSSAQSYNTKQPNQRCTNQVTYFYGAQATLIPGLGGQVSAGNYLNTAGASGSFVSFGGGAGFNIGADAFAGFVNGNPSVLAGRTDAVTIGLGGLSINLIFQPDSSFTSSNFLGLTVGPGADLGLSFSKDNTFLLPTNPGGC
jgi:hypothetical protein